MSAGLEGRDGWPRDVVIGWVEESRDPRRFEHHDRRFTDRDEPAAFLRSERWRYVRYEGSGSDALFDLRADPEEQHDVSDEHPELVREFRARIGAWKREMRRAAARLPGPAAPGPLSPGSRAREAADAPPR